MARLRMQGIGLAVERATVWPAVSAVVLAALCFWFPVTTSAHSYRLGEIAIGHIWSPPAKDNAEGVPVYGPLFNSGHTAARLVSASTPIAKRTRFRTRKNGRINWPKFIVLPPGKPVSLAAWREHIWLAGLRKPLKQGDSFDVTLDFGDRGRITVKVIVEKTPGH